MSTEMRKQRGVRMWRREDCHCGATSRKRCYCNIPEDYWRNTGVPQIGNHCWGKCGKLYNRCIKSKGFSFYENIMLMKSLEKRYDSMSQARKEGRFYSGSAGFLRGIYGKTKNINLDLDKNLKI